MALQLRERTRVDEFANYEQQSPNREINIRTVDNQQRYQGGYDNIQYTQGYVQPQQSYQQPQYTGYFQSQASQYVNNGFSNTQINYGYDYENSQYQYQQDMKFNQINQLRDHSELVKKFGLSNTGKKSINKDMIKIIVTIMVVELSVSLKASQ